MERLEEIEAEYFAKLHPELAKQTEGQAFIHIPKEEINEALPSDWLDVASNLGEDWFRLATQLNNARNLAAHSYDPAAIAGRFGIAGPQATDKVRDKCLQLMKDLLGVTLTADSTDGSGESG